jgi:hypothetical protein
MRLGTSVGRELELSRASPSPPLAYIRHARGPPQLIHPSPASFAHRSTSISGELTSLPRHHTHQPDLPGGCGPSPWKRRSPATLPMPPPHSSAHRRSFFGRSLTAVRPHPSSHPLSPSPPPPRVQANVAPSTAAVPPLGRSPRPPEPPVRRVLGLSVAAEERKEGGIRRRPPCQAGPARHP